MGPVNITEIKKKHDHLWLSRRKLTKAVKASVVAEDDADALNCHHISQLRVWSKGGNCQKGENRLQMESLVLNPILANQDLMPNI